MCKQGSKPFILVPCPFSMDSNQMFRFRNKFLNWYSVRPHHLLIMHWQFECGSWGSMETGKKIESEYDFQLFLDRTSSSFKGLHVRTVRTIWHWKNIRKFDNRKLSRTVFNWVPKQFLNSLTECHKITVVKHWWSLLTFNTEFEHKNIKTRLFRWFLRY